MRCAHKPTSVKRPKWQLLSTSCRIRKRLEKPKRLSSGLGRESRTLPCPLCKSKPREWAGRRVEDRCVADEDDDLKKARARVDALRQSLPQAIDVAALGVWSKAPFQLLCTREALIWRTEELARSACDTLERGDFVAAALRS